MAATLPLREALNESISSGRFEDTKIVLYSRRDSSGNVCRPRALYASSRVLKTVTYFGDILSGTFAEAESKDLSEGIDDSEIAEDYGYYSDSDLEDDDNHNTNFGEPQERPLYPPGSSSRNEKPLPACGEYRERPQQGKVIKVHDVAFITFQAFLLYLYTGHIEFAPYGSEDNRKSRAAEIRSVLEDTIPRPSPKSIYRLADKYEVPRLKTLAWDAIMEGLKQCDVVEEAFSVFASKYQEVRVAQVNHLASLWFRGDEAAAEQISERVDEKIDSYAKGELNHAMEAMALLYERSRGGEDPSENSEEAGPRASSEEDTEWRLLRLALIKSIRAGVLFDRKYWTRHSKTTRTLRPVYFSGVVTGEYSERINSLVKMCRDTQYPDASDGSQDSDCEGEPDHVDEFALEGQVGIPEDTKRESLPFLTLGSFASWRSLFFYICTGVVQFAPLLSQGASIRAQYAREQKTSGKPPPCSPKTIYSIAATLGIKSLRELAFEDIKSKITSGNVAIELFSAFTSRENDVMKMHCELLASKFPEERTTAAMVDLIKDMASGKATYRAGALKLALRNSRPKQGVLLRCPRSDCIYYSAPISLQKIGTGMCCPAPHWPKIMQCAGCGESRGAGAPVECRGCGKRFM